VSSRASKPRELPLAPRAKAAVQGREPSPVRRTAHPATGVPSQRPKFVAAIVAHDHRHVLRRSDVVAREKAEEVSIKVPDDLYVTVLE
jgi:hypothetical protein